MQHIVAKVFHPVKVILQDDYMLLQHLQCHEETSTVISTEIYLLKREQAPSLFFSNKKKYLWNSGSF